MPRKVLVLALISLLVLSVSVFGAMKPKVDDIMRKRLERMENQNYPDESIVTRYVTTPAPKLLGPLPSNVAGFTYYDYQHNDVMRRMIANGTDNNIHITWMDLPSPPIGEERFVDYNSYALGGWLALNGMHVTPEGARGGYTGLDLLPDQREVLCYHRTQPATPPLFWGTTISIETGDPGSGTFASYDISDSVQGQSQDLKGEWPTVACAKVTSSPAYIHITHAEGQTSGSVDKAMYYLRCYRNDVSGKLICQSPGWTDSLIINSNAKLTPNKVCYQYDKCRLGTGVIATSPVSQKVAIVYLKNYASSQNQNELMYIESPVNGQNWINNPATMVPVQLTNYQAGGGLDRGYDDIAAIYDYNDDLHIVWTTFNSTNSNDVTLWHWTPAWGIRKAGFASGAAATDPGAWNLLIAKFTLGIYQPDQTIYLNYTKFKDGDISDGGFANGDIYAKGSTNFGKTWGPEVNMTNTPGPNGCLAGNCKSEHWSSLAERVDDYLHVEYIFDKDPAGIATPEGTMQNDTVIYLKYPRFTIPSLASITYTPSSMIDPPKWVTNAGGSTSDTMSFDNVGTSTLYVKLSGPSWVTMNPNQFNIIEAGPTQNVNVTLSGAGFTDTILVDSIKIESNDGLVGEVYTNVKWVRIHFVVTDNYYYAEFDTCTRGSVLTVSNVGNLGHQEDSSGMFYKGRNYLFDGTPVMATYADSFGNKGYSYMHDRKDFVANGHLTSVDYPNLKVTVWYDIAFLHNATLPQPYHWLWPGWVKLSKIIQFQNNALPGACVLVWNKWIYSEPPIWWPNYAGPSNPAGGYFGFAADWDVPSDASGKNLGDTIPTLNLAYQYSDSSGFTNYYGGYMFLSASKTKGATTTNYDKPYAVRIGANPTQLYPFKGFNNDSLYKYMSTSGWSIESDSSQDMHIVVSAVQELDPDASSIIRVKYACLVSDQGATGIADLASKMKNQKAGDANVDGKVSVSDVVYLINYLFKGGAEPFVAYSDANGDSKISVSDVVYLINYLFKGGPAPVLVWGAEL